MHNASRLQRRPGRWAAMRALLAGPTLAICFAMVGSQSFAQAPPLPPAQALPRVPQGSPLPRILPQQPPQVAPGLPVLPQARPEETPPISVAVRSVLVTGGTVVPQGELDRIV